MLRTDGFTFRLLIRLLGRIEVRSPRLCVARFPLVATMECGAVNKRYSKLPTRITMVQVCTLVERLFLMARDTCSFLPENVERVPWLKI